MSLARNSGNKITEDEYLKGERQSEVKYEYIDGEVFAMAGAGRKHNRILGNVFRETDSQLKAQSSPCTTFSSDMKIKISNNTTHFYYPDVMVSCDEDDQQSQDEHFITSAKIIVEVLSKSTRKFDSTTKLTNYFTIPSLEEYVLIEQDICEVQVFRKSEGWKSSFYFLGDEINFAAINVKILVEDIYYQIKNEDMLEYLSQK